MSDKSKTSLPSNAPDAGKDDTGSMPYAPLSLNRSLTASLKSLGVTRSVVALTLEVNPDLFSDKSTARTQ